MAIESVFPLRGVELISPSTHPYAFAMRILSPPYWVVMTLAS